MLPDPWKKESTAAEATVLVAGAKGGGGAGVSVPVA